MYEYYVSTHTKKVGRSYLFSLLCWSIVVGLPFFAQAGLQASKTKSNTQIPPKRSVTLAPKIQNAAVSKSKTSSKPSRVKKRNSSGTTYRPLIHFLKARAKTKKVRGQVAFSSVEKTRWRIFLGQIEKSAGTLPKNILQKIRKTLELESDKDRNRFSQFPEVLSERIIKNMVMLSVKIGLFRARKVQRAQVVRSKKGLGGPFPKTTSFHKRGKGKQVVPASELPTLVFTQKDLERFQPPKTKLSWPIKGGRIGSGFGWRGDPFTRRRSFHGAVDIGATFGTPIYAAAGGVVLRTGWMSSCGMGVIIRHSPKMKTYYCHMSQLLTSRRNLVSRGQMIGRVGSTGRSTSPHLHFVVSLYGRAVNPRHYLP